MDSAYLSSCLADCGFRQEQQKQYIEYAAGEKKCECLRLLYAQRKKLLDDLHTAQHKVDTIDHLIQALR